MITYDNFFMYNKKIITRDYETLTYKLTEKVFAELNPYSRNKELRKLALSNILSNLVVSFLNGRFLAVSLNSNDYSGYSNFGLPFFTYRIVINWLNLLASQKFVRLFPGYYNKETRRGKRTRLICDEKLTSLIQSLEVQNHNFELINYSPPVILKDKSKRIMQYSISNHTREMINSLNEYNEFISGIQICWPIVTKNISKSIFNDYPSSNQYNMNIYNTLQAYTCRDINKDRNPLLITLEPKLLEYKRLQGQLYRVFNNGKFTEGGRYYGGEYQQLNETDRSKILINSSTVSEIDYSSFHLNMLYHKTNMQFEGDPYSKVVDVPELRPLLKTVNLIAINSQNSSQALRAIKYEITKSLELTRLKNKYKFDERDLLRKFESTHERISQYFYSGVGIKLQNIDSQIADTVLKYFTKREIPCLCVHDSFLVPSQHSEELKDVMKLTYKKFIGFEPKLK